MSAFMRTTDSKSDIAPCPKSAINGRARLFDHLVGGHLHRQRHGKTKRLCGLEIDDVLELRRLLDWQVTFLETSCCACATIAERSFHQGEILCGNSGQESLRHH